jgi:N-methylhydantoinase A
VVLSPADGEGDAGGALKTTRPVYFDEVGDFTGTPIYERELLTSGVEIDGPAVVEQTDTTVLIPPGARARVDRYLNIVIDVSVGAGEAAPVAAVSAANGG